VRLRVALGTVLVLIEIGAPTWAGASPRAGSWDIQVANSWQGAGSFASLALGQGSRPVIAYVLRNDVYVAFATAPGSWSNGPVGQSAFHVTLALDPTDAPRIAGVIGTNEWLAIRLHGGWVRGVLDQALASTRSSIAVRADGTIGLAYVGSDHLLRYADVTSTATTIETVDSPNAADYPSLALDSSGQPHIAYDDFTNDSVKYASRNEAGGWDVQAVLPCCIDAGEPLAIDSSDLGHIIYVNGGSLLYASETAPGSWESEVVEGFNFGTGPALALDSQDRPRIADTTGDKIVFYAKGRVGWIEQIVDGPGGLTDLFLPPSIAIDPRGRSHIAYIHCHTDTEFCLSADLKYASQSI
jgi:hypothetical protein